MQARDSSKEAFPALLEIGSCNGQPFRIDANLIVTGRTCVIGSSGSGKSYAVAVICEELCKHNVPFAVVDTEGEYAGLKEKYEVILISDDENSDLTWEGIDLAEVADQAPEIAPLILDLSEVDNPKDKVGKFLQELYRSLSAKRLPYLVIIEEADRFVPQAGERVGIIGEIARRGRKRGIGLMVCTQRPSLVDKNILSQCGNQLIGKLVIQNDLQSVAQFFGSRGIPRQLTTLAPGNFYAIGGFSTSPSLVTIRKRETRHIGATPLLKERVVKPFMGSLQSNRDVQSKISKEAQAAKAMGLKPTIDEKQVPYLVKKRRQHVIFGEEEKITSISLIWRRLCQATVLQRKGMLRKKFITRYLIFDDAARCLVAGIEPLRYEDSSRKVWGMPQKLLTVLNALDSDKRETLVEVDSRVGYGRSSTRSALKRLEEVSLVSSFDAGRVKLYRRLVEMPELKLTERPVMVEEVKIQPAEEQIGSDKREIREIVKALSPESDVEKVDTIYYPLYRVELMLRGSRRVVYVDGRKGDQVVIP
ncbi:MAG: DUF87 domain-containing protein [Conexivisphaerales archaeon]